MYQDAYGYYFEYNDVVKHRTTGKPGFIAVVTERLVGMRDKDGNVVYGSTRVDEDFEIDVSSPKEVRNVRDGSAI